MKMAPVLGVGLALLGGSGCTFSDGEPYGLVEATMAASYELRDDRDVGEPGWQKLSSELELRLDEALLALELVELIDVGGDALASLTFDPANPPAGYTLCHNGHCHSQSGDLVDYEDVQAELSGGEATSSTALALRGGAQDLLSGEPVPLDCGSEGGDAADCVMGQGNVTLVRVTASRLEIRGVLRDGLDPPRFDGERTFEGTILLLPSGEQDTTSGVLEASVQLPLDDDHASRIALDLSLAASAALFDGLDAEAIAADPAEVLSLHDQPTIRSAFAELSLAVAITRDDP